uniref:protein-tyrosine-phosphatase n=1 Tax=Globisporangium ultimum (strain ATCC 200006 / CBS 805.95 / DAOM BR144) TaxID=431595 RepID=K3WHJ0_GLOUD
MRRGSITDNVKPVEFVPDLLYYMPIAGAPPYEKDNERVLYFSIDDKLHYNNFYLDFGPLNLGCTIQFTTVLTKMVLSARQTKRKIVLFSSPEPHFRANAVCLLCCWGVLANGMKPEDTVAKFTGMTFPPFHDASPTECEYKLTILDCINGLARAVGLGYVTPHEFDVREYHHYEQVENGDLSWISPKFVAFAGPHDTFSASPEGYVTLTPEHYVPYFKRKKVTLVVRLNEKQYDEARFMRAGIQHLDLEFPDGGNPPEFILNQFIAACEQTPGAVAVHCKAGLGRTGTCIGAFLMKHGKFTAKEVIGWLRLCRPGSVIGPQQQHLDAIQHKMWNAAKEDNNNEEEENARTSRRSFFSKRKSGNQEQHSSSRFSIFKTKSASGSSTQDSHSEKADKTPTYLSPSPKSHVTEKTQGDNLLQMKQSYQHHYVR